MIPLSLYIHIPWCERKCPYCDFNSHQSKGDVEEKKYVQALLDDLTFDLSHHQRLIGDRKLSSVFIGGGTPSLFSAQSIADILSGVRARIDFEENIEITLEANPGSAEADRFLGFREAGVNRLSIGIQSFNDTHLTKLGRIHDSQNAISAAKFARQAGFENFNLDLMFGLPEQSLSQALDDLYKAFEINPKHLSCYQLTIEPNTLFHHRPPVTPDNDTLWEMQLELQAALKNHGYTQYEVSAYSQAEHRCQHNSNYWQFGDYLGIGAGAHSKISSPEVGVYRSWKIKHPNSYQRCLQENKDPSGSRDKVDDSALPFEFMLNALRLIEGFDIDLFQERTFLSRDTIMPQLEKHNSQGLLELKDRRLNLTARGKSMVDTMLQDYLV